MGLRLAEAIEQWALARGHRGLTAFSKASGIPYSSLSDYLKGAQPSAWALWRIAETTHVSTDYLLTGQDRPSERSPTEHGRALLAVLRRPAHFEDLPRDAQRRYRDRVHYVGVQIRRLVFDTMQFFAELHAHAQRLKFDADEFRREWVDGEREEEEEDHP